MDTKYDAMCDDSIAVEENIDILLLSLIVDACIAEQTKRVGVMHKYTQITNAENKTTWQVVFRLVGSTQI